MNNRDSPDWFDAKNKKALLVGRISDRKQVDGVSLDAQERHLRGYVKTVGLTVANVVSFQESAKKSELRVQFHAAIGKARRQKVRHLVFYAFDRIARNFTDVEILEEMIRDGAFILHVVAERMVLHAHSPDSDFDKLDLSSGAHQEWSTCARLKWSTLRTRSATRGRRAGAPMAPARSQL